MSTKCLQAFGPPANEEAKLIMNSQYISSYRYIGEPITQMFRRRLSMQDLHNYASVTDYIPDTKKSVDYSLMPPLERLDQDELSIPSTLYQVHPKKKLRIAYDRELAETTVVNSTSRQSDSNLRDASELRSDKYFANNSISSDNCCQTLSPAAPFSVRVRTQCQFKYIRNSSRKSNNSGFNPPELIPMNSSVPNALSVSLTPPRSNTPEYHTMLSPDFDETHLSDNISWNPTYPKTDSNEVNFPVNNSPSTLTDNMVCSANIGKTKVQCDSLIVNSAVQYNKSELSQDQPEDLRVRSNERLKDVARGICSASTLPLLNSVEIPSILSLESISKRGQRMSADALCHSIQKSPRDLSRSPACGVSCSSSYHDQFSPHSSNTSLHQPSPNFRNKDISWSDEIASRHSHGSTTNHKPHRQPSQPCYTDDGTEDPEGYLRKPIGSWTYADVVFFLMEACKEIRIDPNEVQFKSTDNGLALLQMSPGDFEVLAANNGQKLYDYFIKFKTQHYMISESQSVRPSYNYEDNYPPPHQEPYSPCDDRQNNHPPGFPEHYHGYPDYHNHRGSAFGSPTYQSPTYPHPPESPSQEYVPQGAQYTSLHDQQHRTFQSPDDRNGRFHDTPSAAGKTFPPLHSYDDPVSDLEFSEDEKLPEIPKKRGPGRPPKPENERKRKAKKTGRLWEFIRNLLLDPKTCPSLVRWEDHQEGVFRIVQSDVIANKWGMRKNNEKMNYEKLSRAMRYYYKAKIFEPVLGKRLVYKFGSNAKGWRPLNPNNPNFQNAY